MKTMILTAVLAVALMLAGCGGGGSRIASTPPPTPEPTPTPTPEPEPTPEPTPTPEPEPYNPVSSVDWLREPLFGWDRRTGPYSYDPTTNVREYREQGDGYELYSYWGELRSGNEFLGYYGIQSRPGGSIEPWFTRHTYITPPAHGNSASATWNGRFLGRAFRRQFDYTDEGWTQANDLDARLADTETLTVGGAEVPYATELIGDVAMTVRFSPGSTTVDWELSNSRTPTGGAFGPVVFRDGNQPIGRTNMDRSYSPFPVNPNGTFSSSGTNPYGTRQLAYAAEDRGDDPGETFEISGAFVGSGGHGVLGTINSIHVLAAEITNIPPPDVYIIRSWGLRGAFGALREE